MTSQGRTGPDPRKLKIHRFDREGRWAIGWLVKIIARVNHDKLLVEMSEQEIANVIGKNTPGEMRVPTYGREITGFEVGMEYKVSQAWYRLRDQASAAEQLKNVSKTLAALSDLVLQTEVQFTNATATQVDATPAP